MTLRDQNRQTQLSSPFICPQNFDLSPVLPISRGLGSPTLSSVPNHSLPTNRDSLTPLQSALTENASVTLLESALTKSLALKPFRIRTYEKKWGEGCKLLSRLAPTTLPGQSRRPSPIPPAHCSTGHSVPQSALGRKQLRPSRCLSL